VKVYLVPKCKPLVYLDAWSAPGSFCADCDERSLLTGLRSRSGCHRVLWLSTLSCVKKLYSPGSVVTSSYTLERRLDYITLAYMRHYARFTNWLLTQPIGQVFSRCSSHRWEADYPHYISVISEGIIPSKPRLI
jgi:hypothetical protein